MCHSSLAPPIYWTVIKLQTLTTLRDRRHNAGYELMITVHSDNATFSMLRVSQVHSTVTDLTDSHLQ